MVTLRKFAHVVELLDGYAGQKIVTEALHAAGLDRRVLRHKTGFAPYATEAVLIEHVARAIGDRHPGARLGRDFRYSEYGAFAGYVLGAPDLGTALERGRRALVLTHPGSAIELRQSDSHITVGRDSSGLSVTGHRHLDEGALFVIRTVVRHFLGAGWSPDWVELPNPSADDMAVLEALLDAPVRARDGPPAIAIRLADLATMNPADGWLGKNITVDELAALMGVTPVQSLTETVAQILLVTMENKDLSEKTVARHLAIGPRTLQRALRRDGTSFHAIRAHFKAARATSLVAETTTPIEEIARSLGYKDARSFRRAFHQWTGLSPSDYRQSQAREAGETDP